MNSQAIPHPSAPHKAGNFFSRHKLFAGVLVIAALLVAAYVYAFEWAPWHLTVNRQEVRLRHWHKEHDGLKVVLLSDIHLWESQRQYERLRRAVAIANAEKPDLILLLGDYTGGSFFIHESASQAEIAEELKHLRARYGVFAVLGNHDWWRGGTLMSRELSKRGITVLENSYATVQINGRELNLAGYPDKTRSFLLLRETPVSPANTEPTILLTHNPDYFDFYANRFELTVAGHNHGGQFRIPFFGAPLVPSRFRWNRASGWNIDPLDNRKMFITSGVGTSILSMRVFCPPEIAVLEIRKEE